MPDEVDSVVVIAGGRALLYADAVIGIGLALGGWYRRGAQAARVIPRPLRDAGYRFLARHRYKWFGHHDACWMPTSELRSRFAADGLA